MKQNLKNIKKIGFKTPDNYFDTLEDQIVTSLNLDESLGNVKEAGFEMPKDYLDSVEDKVFKSLEIEERLKLVSLFSKRNLMYVSGIAATLLIFFSIFINSRTETNESIGMEYVENYIIAEDIDSYEIAALLSDDNLTEDIFIESDIMDGSLETYILENTTIEDLLIE